MCNIIQYYYCKLNYQIQTVSGILICDVERRDFVPYFYYYMILLIHLRRVIFIYNIHMMTQHTHSSKQAKLCTKHNNQENESHIFFFFSTSILV